MTITPDTSVAAILLERPDLRWTLVEGGLEPLAREDHIPPPQRTVGEAAMRHGLDVAAFMTKLNRAASAGPDEVFVAKMKAKYAGFTGGCCGGH
jgi:hypothetical protein